MAALTVGLTGGLGAGKSTVLAEFRRLGAEVFDADAIVHELLAEPAVAGKVARRFGRDLVQDGRVDRKALGRRVFGRPAELRALERLLHPEVMRRMEAGLRRSRKAVAVGDVPLLFEKGLSGRFDLTMTVSAPESARLARLAKRGLTRAESKKRVKLHWPTARKERLSDVVLDNAGPWKRVRPVVKQYYKAFELLAQGSGKR